ncbi:MAG: hypothetical protein AAF787_07930 [Chloroflexota bacterium]
MRQRPSMETTHPMPTPFSHLVAVDRLLTDADVPATIRDVLNAQRAAYLLGSVAPDARVNAENPRAATHFYHYEIPYEKAPWRIMLDENPSLAAPTNPAHRAFVAGYVAHLAMDQVWTEDMLVPYFGNGEWGADIKARFFVLHLMLIDMDERDLHLIPDYAPDEICAAQPDDWLPFMPQDVLIDWQQMIYNQIKPDGESKTYDIFGERVKRAADELRRLAGDDDWMHEHLWQHVPRTIMGSVEDEMYDHARDSLIAYMQEH